jgi:hypothetical protein
MYGTIHAVQSAFGKLTMPHIFGWTHGKSMNHRAALRRGSSFFWVLFGFRGYAPFFIISNPNFLIDKARMSIAFPLCQGAFLHYI